MKKFVLGGIVLSALMALTTFAARADDTIRFGIAAEPYPPFTSKDSSGKWVGFEVDLMDAVCANLKAKCEIVESAGDGIFPEPKANKCEGIWPPWPTTESGNQRTDFPNSNDQTPPATTGRKWATS